MTWVKLPAHLSTCNQEHAVKHLHWESKFNLDIKFELMLEFSISTKFQVDNYPLGVMLPEHFSKKSSLRV